MYLVYLLKSDKYSYVGMTNNFTRRLRQHNKEIKGGARYTSNRDSWYPVLIIDGFQDMKSAMQCEWRLKRGKKGVDGRIRYLNDYLLKNDKWTSKSDLIINQNLTYYIDDDYKNELSFDTKELYWK
uniref:GIY-YIG domain-containing protein n=1 Tax=viral metagenome TaxID=1070528 RepID=A0A6C0CZG1_9ZZZZ